MAAGWRGGSGGDSSACALALAPACPALPAPGLMLSCRPIDLYDFNSMFGTPQDLQQLLETLDKHDFLNILDVSHSAAGAAGAGRAVAAEGSVGPPARPAAQGHLTRLRRRACSLPAGGGQPRGVTPWAAWGGAGAAAGVLAPGGPATCSCSGRRGGWPAAAWSLRAFCLHLQVRLGRAPAALQPIL